ncbi:hypothetical protein ANRL4_01654 [Anaerolineae bacterium]|nr:hypothetical protein ANRL4_01654 [Anaerolineae bacterium]
MSAMQLFYNRLFQGPEVHNPNLARLLPLTQINPAQAQVLKTDLSWTEWPWSTQSPTTE